MENVISWSNSRILVVVAHPDDEVLGLGGSLNKLIEIYNAVVHVVVLGEGITSRSSERDTSLWEDELIVHRNNIILSQKKIGYRSLSIYDFPDNRFDTIPLLDIIKVIENEKNIFKPDVIFTHHGGDLNIDHQLTFDAVITASRPLPHESLKAIITFETPSGTEWRASSDPKNFIPNYYISISENNLLAKISAMQCYEFEKRQFPHPRSPEALRILAQRWGIVLGKDLVEAFTIIRLID